MSVRSTISVRKLRGRSTGEGSGSGSASRPDSRQGSIMKVLDEDGDWEASNSRAGSGYFSG